MPPIFPEPAWQKYKGTQNNVPLNDPLALIYNEAQWKLYKVSPMYNLLYEAVKLKQYATKIRQSIVGSVTASSSIKYMVSVEAEPHVKYAKSDPHGLKISVMTSITEEPNSKTKLAYTAILLSWGIYTKLTNATHLPYMLERGEQRIGAAVKSTLQTVFDCIIKQFCFTQPQLLQFGFNLLKFDTSKESEQFVMVYRTPQVDHKDKLTFSFDIGDVRLMWNEAQKDATDPLKVISLAHQIIQQQIFHVVHVDITAFNLCEVLLPKAEVKNNGIIKMKTAEIVNCTLTILSALSEYKELINASS